MAKIKHIQYINMPRSVLVDNDLSENEKKVLSNIINVIGAGGVYRFHNSWIADYLQCHKNSVSRIITRLKNKGIIDVDIVRDSKGQVVKRVITLTNAGITKYVGGVQTVAFGGGPSTSVKYNNKVSNINNNTKSISNDIQCLFDEFWNNYPRNPKGNKTEGLRRFKKLTKSQRDELPIGLKNYLKYKEVSGEKLHQGHVFIGQKIWENYMDMPDSDSKSNPADCYTEEQKKLKFGLS